MFNPEEQEWIGIGSSHTKDEINFYAVSKNFKYIKWAYFHNLNGRVGTIKKICYWDSSKNLKIGCWPYYNKIGELIGKELFI